MPVRLARARARSAVFAVHSLRHVTALDLLSCLCVPFR